MVVETSSLWAQAAEAVNDFMLTPTAAKSAVKSFTGGAFQWGETGGDVHQESRDDALGTDATVGMKSVTKQDSVLYEHIRKRDWESVINRVLSVPSEARTWIVDKGSDGTVQWKMLPLHQACELHCSAAVVKTLVRTFPAAVTLKDSGGELPIHFLFRTKGAAIGPAVLAMLDADPKSASIPNEGGRLALHLACRTGGSDMEGVIDRLLAAHHRGSAVQDSYGLLPLHHACVGESVTPRIVETLLRANPHSVDVQDNWGRTPRAIVEQTAYSDAGAKEKLIDALRKDTSHWSSAELMAEISLRCNDADNGLTEAEAVKAMLEENRTENKRLTEGLRKAMEQNEELAVKAFDASSIKVEKEALEDENKRLTEEVEDGVAKLAEATEKGERIEMENKSLRSRFAGLETNVKRLEEDNKRLVDEAGELKKLEQETKLLWSGNRRFEADNDRLEQENLRLTNQVREQAKSLSMARELIEGMEGETERLRRRNTRLEVDNDRIRGQIGELGAENGELRSELVGMEGECGRLTRSNEYLGGENKRVEKDNVRLEGYARELEKKLDRLTGVFREMELQRNRSLMETDDFLKKASSFIFEPDDEKKKKSQNVHRHKSREEKLPLPKSKSSHSSKQRNGGVLK